MFNLPDFQAEAPIVKKDLSKAFEDSTIDLTKKVERPPLLASIGIDDVAYKGTKYPIKLFSRGNISLITGEEKSRKSFVKSLIEACIIGGRANEFDNDLIKGYLEDGELIISIDGEQSTYDVWLNGIRIPEMCGSHPPHYKIVKWREKSKDERLALLDWLFMDSPFKDNIGLVFIDGYVDFIKDFNSQEESGGFSDLLLKYSSITNSHICGVLHLNPGSEKSRGHAGTILQQKSEVVIMVTNMGEYSVVKCKRVRGSKPFKTFTIRINENWLPYISDDEIDNNTEIKLK